MQYKMVVRRTMFDFDLTAQGSVKLCSVRFLHDTVMKKQNDLLLVTEDNAVQFFLDRATPVAHLSREQFRFVSAASKYFGHITDEEQLPVWLWAGSLELPENRLQPYRNICAEEAEPVRCA
jgi:hypothetical protein